MKHIKGLDTLRAFAVIFVVVEHWGPNFNETQPVLFLLKHYLVPDGQSGVDLFFVLSGFLITAILLHAKASNDGNNKLFIIKNFMIRRALRIFPIYYLMLTLLLLINYIGVRDNFWHYFTYTSNILFFRNNAWGAIPHTWSLAVEEQFYLFWPFIILFINDKYLKFVFAAAILTGIVSGYITTDVLHKGNYPILVYNCLGCFGLGGFYAYARMNEQTCRRFEKALLPLFFICAGTYFHWKYISDNFWAHTTFLFRMIDGVISLQFIIWVINNRSEWVRKNILENRALNYIGKISYGIYLYHYILQPVYDGFIGRLMQRHPNLPSTISNYYFAYCVKLCLLLLICSASYAFIEQPILNVKNKFLYKKNQ